MKSIRFIKYDDNDDDDDDDDGDGDDDDDEEDISKEVSFTGL